MRSRTRCHRGAGVMTALLGSLVLLALAGTAQAQLRPGTAEITRVVGHVEIRPQGALEWGPASVGARLAELGEIRTASGASADLRLPDASTLVVAENSRIVLTKLEVDPRTQARETTIFHVAVGKVRATLARAAITLVRVRQSNFVISTPTAVAAARGTEWVVYYGPVDRLAAETPQVPPDQARIGVWQGTILCLHLGGEGAGVVPSGQVVSANCIGIPISADARREFFDGRRSPHTLNHPVLSALRVTPIDPQSILNAMAPHARIPGDVPEQTSESTGSSIVNPFGYQTPTGQSLSPHNPRGTSLLPRR